MSSLAGGSLAFQAGTGLFLPLNRPFFLGAQLSCHFCPLLFIPSNRCYEHPLRSALPILGTASMLLAEFSSVSSSLHAANPPPIFLGPFELPLPVPLLCSAETPLCLWLARKGRLLEGNHSGMSENGLCPINASWLVSSFLEHALPLEDAYLPWGSWSQVSDPFPTVAASPWHGAWCSFACL